MDSSFLAEEEKLRGIFVVTTALLLSLSCVVPAFAGVVTASSAGPLPGSAQDLVGLFPTEIIGSLSLTDPNDVNMFKVLVYEPAQFFALANAVSFGAPDTVLSLFDSSGAGVYLNDDISGSDTLSCLPSDILNPCPSIRGGIGPGAFGIYYLAISRSANYPIDSSSNEIFSPVLFTDVVGPSVTNPVAGWDGGSFTSPNFDLINYDITLGGTIPEPGTMCLTGAAGGLLLMAVRRRRSS